MHVRIWVTTKSNSNKKLSTYSNQYVKQLLKQYGINNFKDTFALLFLFNYVYRVVQRETLANILKQRTKT